MNRVIKAVGGDAYTSISSVNVRPADFSAQLKEPKKDAEKIIGAAKNEAAIILKSAKAEAESESDSIRENARIEGYNEGLASGIKDGAEKAQVLIDKLEADIKAAIDERKSIIDAIEPELLKLCMESVEKIVKHEIKTNPDVVIRMVRSCLRRVKDSKDVYVRVNPAEVEHVRAQREELLSICEGVHSINIVDDRRVSCGGCVVESSSGDFDAKIDTQIGRLNAKLTETLENGNS